MKEPQSSTTAIFIEQKKITIILKLSRNIQITEAELYAKKQGLKYIKVYKQTNMVIYSFTPLSLNTTKPETQSLQINHI